MNFDERQDKDELRQLLLELHYDLLDDEEAAALRSAIETDPEVASEWAATLRLVGRLADATKFEGTPLPRIPVAHLVSPSSNGSVGHSQESINNHEVLSEEPASPAVVVPSKPGRWIGLSSVLAVTAAMLGMMVISGWYMQRVPAEPVAMLRLEAEPIAPSDATGSNEFQLRTTRMDFSSSMGKFPVTPAKLSFSVLANNTVLFTGKTVTDDEGTGTIRLPKQLVIPKEAKLQVTANGSDLSASSIELPLEPTRCLTYLTVDRPVYRPGETVFFRSLTLTRRTLRSNLDVPIRFELIDPSGSAVPGAYMEGVTERGVGNGFFVIPESAPGGPYRLAAKSLDDFFPEESVEFQVREYRVPRIKKELEFRQRSYGPGEWVQAEFSAERAEGGPVANAAVRVRATVDDEVVYQTNLTTSADGSCIVAFSLPEIIREGSGQLSLSIDDGGTRETKSKTIPIQLGRIAVDFYPEGGYLVDGLVNRVYFAARDTLGNPIEVAGEIQSRSGQKVATAKTVRDGMGVFEMVPQLGETYTLRATQPLDVENFPTLPSVVKDLPVIDTGSGVFDPERPISFVVRSHQATKVLVQAACRGELVGEQEFELSAGDTPLTLPMKRGAGGVIRITVLDATKTPALPMVERLVYRRMDRKLSIEIQDRPTTGDDASLARSPGESMRLSLQVRDEAGRPVPAVLGVSVVDDASLSLADTKPPGLRTHFLLTSEIENPEDLEFADLYLASGEEAAESLDLLLGTQGWRRFIRGNYSKSELAFREQLVRLFELDGDPNLSAASYTASGAEYRQQMKSYQTRIGEAWAKLLEETRYLLLFILCAWLISVAIYIRRNARMSPAALTLLALASLVVVGCARSVDSYVASPESESQAATDAFGSEEADFESSQAPMFADATTPEDGAGDAISNLVDIFNNIGSGSPGRNRGDASDEQAKLFGTRSDSLSEPGRQTVLEMLGSGSSSITPDDLNQLLRSRGLDAQTLADELLRELRFPVRQYAHQYQPSSSDDRTDFTETLYWQPLLITDSEGKATIRFDLSDSVSSFRVRVDGHSADGRIGSGLGQVISRLPFQIEPKLPLEVTAGDVIDLPIAVINASDDPNDVRLSVTADAGLELSEDATQTITVPANGRSRGYTPMTVLSGMGNREATLQVRGTSSGDHSDGIQRSLRIAPGGFPISRSIAGRLNGQTTIELPIPNGLIPDSLNVSVRAYPSPLADVMSGVESILREPHGCFEQTSATNYPNTMALQYLRESETANPDVSRRALGMLDRGYGKLTAFECEKLGFEWFGDDPGHEALSAFGLMQFTDMAKVMNVSAEMMERTRTWLMGRRDGRGGFQRNPRHLHVWSVKQPIVNAYVLWAISEADVSAGHPQRSATELRPELDQMATLAKQSDDAYLIALSAATLLNVQRMEEGEALLQRLTKLQRPDGSVQGKTTVTSSGGVSLTMETTALAALAWTKSPQHVSQARDAIGWIQSNRVAGGGFGSTQATVLALKALVAFSKHAQSSAGSDLEIRLKGTTIGQARLPYQPEGGSTVEINGLGKAIEAAAKGEDSINLELISRGSKNLSFSLDVTSHVDTPDSHPDCPVQITTQWSDTSKAITSTMDGELIKVVAEVRNQTAEGQPMTVAVVGLPGGVEPRTEQLDELKSAGVFDYYEIRGRDVVFYWRVLEPNAVKSVEFHVTATVPGTYTAPASRTYLYYTAEQKHWTNPLKISIAR